MPGAKKYILPSFAYFGYNFAFTMFTAFIPLLLKSNGIRHDLIGVLVAMHPLMLLVCAVPFGMIGDRLSPRTAAISGLLLISASTFSIIYCTSFVGFLVAFSFCGVGTALYQVNAGTLYFKSLGDTRRGIKLALFNSMAHIGYGAGPFLAGAIIAAGHGLRGVLAAAAAIFIPFALLTRAVPDAASARFAPSLYIEDLRDRRKWFMLAIIFLYALHFGAENVCYSLFLKYNCNISEAGIGIVFLYIGLGLIPAAIATGIVADRARRSDLLMALGLLISGGMNVATVFADSFWPVVFIRVLHAVGDGIFLVYLDVSVAKLFPSQRIGAPVGLRDMTKTAGTLTGALIAGFIPSYSAPFAVMGAVSLILSPFVLRYFKTD